MADGDNEGQGGGQEGENMEPPEASFIIDPVLASTIDVGYAHPVCASPTNDPNRFTIHVPTDETVFSLGKGADGAHHIKDDGITGRTKKHIHFEVKEEDKTVVVMGGPALDSGMCSWDGDTIAANNKGYAMCTEGFAWQEAKEQHVLMCSEGDILVRTKGEGKLAGLQSDTGKALCFGGEGVALASPGVVSIGAYGSAAPQDVKHEGGFADQWTPNHMAKVGSLINTVGEVATSILAMVGSMRKVERSGEEGKPGFVKSRAAGAVKMAVDMGLTLSTIGRAIAEFSGHEFHGTVGIAGENFVGITAGIGATMYGHASSAIVSIGQAEVLGGVSALVKGLAWTEIAGGFGTAVTALGSVEVAATKGKVEISGKKEVAVSALEGAVLITALKDAQLVSNTEHAYVYGKEAGFLGAEGWAFQCTEHGLSFGKATAPQNFKAPAFDAQNVFKMSNDAIECYRGAAGYALRDNKVTLFSNGKAGELLIDGSNIKVDGARICLG